MFPFFNPFSTMAAFPCCSRVASVPQSCLTASFSSCPDWRASAAPSLFTSLTATSYDHAIPQDIIIQNEGRCYIYLVHLFWTKSQKIPISFAPFAYNNVVEIESWSTNCQFGEYAGGNADGLITIIIIIIITTVTFINTQLNCSTVPQYF